MEIKLIFYFSLLSLMGSCTEKSSQENLNITIQENTESNFSINLIFKSSIDTLVIIDRSIFYNTHGGLCNVVSARTFEEAINHLKCSNLLIEYENGNFDYFSDICEPKNALNNFFPFPAFEHIKVEFKQNRTISINNIDMSIVEYLLKYQSKFRLIIFTNFYDDKNGTVSITDSTVFLGNKYLYQSEFTDLNEAYKRNEIKFLDFVFQLN